MIFAELLPELPIFETLSAVGGVLLFGLLLCGLVVASTRMGRAKARNRGLLGTAIYCLFMIAVAVLAGTSFGSLLLEGHVGGFALLVHVAVAGAFTFLLLGIAVLYLPLGFSAAGNEQEGSTSNRWWITRWSATGLVVSGVVTAATMFVSMLPILDTEGLLAFAQWHRYAGLCVVVFALCHLFSLVITKLGWR